MMCHQQKEDKWWSYQWRLLWSYVATTLPLNSRELLVAHPFSFQLTNHDCNPNSIFYMKYKKKKIWSKHPLNYLIPSQSFAPPLLGPTLAISTSTKTISFPIQPAVGLFSPLSIVKKVVILFFLSKQDGEKHEKVTLSNGVQERGRRMDLGLKMVSCSITGLLLAI